jgi:hypothetical protein
MEERMNKVMTDYIIEELDVRGIPYDMETEAGGRTTFTFDDRMMAEVEITNIFNHCFAQSSSGWVEAIVTH